MRVARFLALVAPVALVSLLACATDQGDPFLGGDGPGVVSGDDGGTSATKDGSTSSPTPTPTSTTPGSPTPGADSGVAAVDSGGGGPTPGVDAGSPANGTDAGAPPANGFDQFENHNLEVINMYRATLNLTPLVLDQELTTFAIAGSQELSMDHMAHQHFINAENDGTLWTSGFMTTAEENQGDPNGWTVLDTNDPTQNELDQIDAIQLAMFNEGPGTGDAHGHYENMMNTTVKRLGVGLLEVGGMLYLTNDFSD